MEMLPVLPIEEKHTNTDQIGNVLVEVSVVQSGELIRIFFSLANDFLQQMAGCLGSVAIGMNPCLFDIIKVFVDKLFSDIPQGVFVLLVLCLVIG